MACLLRRGLFAAVFALAFTTACTPVDGEPTDGGTDTTDAGENGDGNGNDTPDAGDGDGNGNDTPDAGDGPGPSLELGAACTYGSDACGEGMVCTSIFTQQGSQDIDTSTASCYAACDTAGAACTAALGQSGTCQASPDGNGNICVVASPNLGPCGNGANASCSNTPICLFPEPGAPVGFCGTACSVADPSTCTAIPDQGAPNDGCGCSETQECSTSPFSLGEGEGLCAPPSSEGDTCGIDPATGTLGVCTGDLQCAAAAGAATGTCQAATDGEGGGE